MNGTYECDDAQSDTTDEEDFTLTPSDLQIQHQVAYDSEVIPSTYNNLLFLKYQNRFVMKIL